jgi:hypothetical protein
MLLHFQIQQLQKGFSYSQVYEHYFLQVSNVLKPWTLNYIGVLSDVTIRQLDQVKIIWKISQCRMVTSNTTDIASEV